MSVERSTAGARRLMLIDEPYCRDVLYLARAGSLHHNYERYVDERITRDDISISCFEKAGATCVHGRGRWRFIVDSDRCPQSRRSSRRN